jgi:hypothetical protein
MIESPVNPKPDSSHWRRARPTDIAKNAAIDYSLAFHRLQEARQELYLARLPSSTLSPRERERLIAYCEATLATAERWVARASESLAKDAEPPVPEVSR